MCVGSGMEPDGQGVHGCPDTLVSRPTHASHSGDSEFSSRSVPASHCVQSLDWPRLVVCAGQAKQLPDSVPVSNAVQLNTYYERTVTCEACTYRQSMFRQGNFCTATELHRIVLVHTACILLHRHLRLSLHEHTPRVSIATPRLFDATSQHISCT